MTLLSKKAPDAEGRIAPRADPIRAALTDDGKTRRRKATRRSDSLQEVGKHRQRRHCARRGPGTQVPAVAEVRRRRLPPIVAPFFFFLFFLEFLFLLLVEILVVAVHVLLVEVLLLGVLFRVEPSGKLIDRGEEALLELLVELLVGLE